MSENSEQEALPTPPLMDTTYREIYREAQQRAGRAAGGTVGQYPNYPNSVLGLLGPAALRDFRGHNARVRENITEIRIGCQVIQLYAGNGVVELRYSGDPSNEWQMLSADATSTLGQALMDKASTARDKMTVGGIPSTKDAQLDAEQYAYQPEDGR